jgi:hypothetical protein
MVHLKNPLVKSLTFLLRITSLVKPPALLLKVLPIAVSRMAAKTALALMGGWVIASEVSAQAVAVDTVAGGLWWAWTGTVALFAIREASLTEVILTACVPALLFSLILVGYSCGPLYGVLSALTAIAMSFGTITVTLAMFKSPRQVAVINGVGPWISIALMYLLVRYGMIPLVAFWIAQTIRESLQGFLLMTYLKKGKV